MAGVALGSAEQNHFLFAGFVLSLSSSIATIALAFRNALKARNATFVPESIPKHRPLILPRSPMVVSGDRIAELEKRVDALTRWSEHDAKIYAQQIATTNARIDLVINAFEEHELVTLPRILAEHSAWIIATSLLAVVGAAWMFWDGQMYRAFGHTAGWLGEGLKLAASLISP